MRISGHCHVPIITLALAALCVFLPLASAHSDPEKVYERTLPNGMRLIVQHESATSLVAVDVFIGTAGAPEDASWPGLADLTASVLLSSTVNQDHDTLARSVGNLGGNVSAFWDRNYTQVRSLTLASSFPDDAYLLSDVLKNSSYTDSEIKDARTNLLQSVQTRSDDVFDQTYDQLKTKLYAGEGITPETIGDPDVIRTVSADKVRLFYAHYYTADNIVISVVGNIDPDTALNTLAQDFNDFPRPTFKRKPMELPIAVTPLTQPVIVKSYRGDITAGYVMVGYRVPGAGRDEYPSLILLNAILGGMKTSLLFTNLRIAKGLGYETSSIYGEDVGVSDLTGYILSSGDPQPTPPKASVKIKAAADPTASTVASGSSFTGVRESLLSQFKAIQDLPPSDQMLSRAKRYVIGANLIGHERLADRAYWLGYSETALKPLGGFKFDTDFASEIDAVTAEDVQHVAQKYLSQGYVLSMVLPGDPNAGEVSK